MTLNARAHFTQSQFLRGAKDDMVPPLLLVYTAKEGFQKRLLAWGGGGLRASLAQLQKTQ